MCWSILYNSDFIVEVCDNYVRNVRYTSTLPLDHSFLKFSLLVTSLWKRKTTREALAFFCSLLESLGIAGVTSDLLRQAKSNSPCAAIKLWRPLHDLVCLHLVCFPSPSPSSSFDHLHCLFQELWANSTYDHLRDAAAFVKFFVALWGYPANSRFFALPFDTRHSRELLLVLAWLASHCDVFLRGIEARCSEHLAAISAAFSGGLPRDVAPLAGARAGEVERGVDEFVSRIFHAARRRGSQDRERFLRNNLLVLYGRIGVILKSIHSLQSAKARLIHELNQVQIEACQQKIQHRLYSQFELHLMQDPGAAREHHRALEAERQLRSDLANFSRHEENFWNWMADDGHEDDDPLLIASRSPSIKQEPTCDSGVSQEELIPVIKFLKEPRDECGVAPLPSDVLELLAPAFTAKSQSSRKRGGDRAAFGKFSDASFKFSPGVKVTTSKQSIQWLEEAVEKLSIGHKELRDQHRLAIERELQHYLEDESFVVVGL